MKLLNSLILLSGLLFSFNSLACERLESNQNYSDLNKIISCLEKKIESLNSDIETLKQQAKTSNGKTVVVEKLPDLPTPTIEQSKEIGGIRFDIHGCAGSSSTVNCRTTITALGGDTFISLNYKSIHAFAVGGTEGKLSAITIAGQRVNMAPTGIKKQLKADYPIEFNLHFSGVNESADRLASIDFNIYAFNGSHKSSMKHIVIQR